jgi:hypothetical protein
MPLNGTGTLDMSDGTARREVSLSLQIFPRPE